MAKKPRSAIQKAPKRRSSFFDEVELSLASALGRKVKVTNKGNKGTLEIEFYSQDDLKNIANSLYKE